MFPYHAVLPGGRLHQLLTPVEPLQAQTAEMPPPSAKVNGLELALQRAWVDAAARRAKRDSLGELLKIIVVSRCK